MPADNDPVQMRDYLSRQIQKVPLDGDVYLVIGPDSRPKDLTRAERNAFVWFLNHAGSFGCVLCAAPLSTDCLGHRQLGYVVLDASSAAGICTGCADRHVTAPALVRAISERTRQKRAAALAKKIEHT